MILLVDGYNLYFGGVRPVKGSMPDADWARRKVAELIRRYCRARKCRAIVFFDGAPSGGGLSRRLSSAEVEVRYTLTHSDADTAIKEFISSHRDKTELRIVTNDRAIQRFADKSGAPWEAVKVFLAELAERETKGLPRAPSDEPGEKLAGARGDELDYWLRVFGRPPSPALPGVKGGAAPKIAPGVARNSRPLKRKG